MKRQSLIFAVVFGILGTWATLAFAQPALAPPELMVSTAPSFEMDSFMRYGGFQTELDELEKTGSSECTCEDCTCGTRAASVATKMVTRYRSIRRATGRMIQECFGGTCRMVPEMTTVSEPYQVEVPVGTPEVVTTTTSSVMSDVCPDCGQVHAPMVSGTSVNSSTGLMYRANGRQKLFQPLRRWRLRFSTGRLFPNSWWNR